MLRQNREMTRYNNISFTIAVYILLTFVFLLLVIGKISHSSSKSQDYTAKVKFFQPVIEKLLKKGVDSGFVFNLLANPKTQFNEKYIRINVTGFLKKTTAPDRYDWRAVEKSRSFIIENESILDSCERTYSVPREVITAVLWSETKLGDFLGTNHIASVFLSTSMAYLPQFINLNIMYLTENFSGDSTTLDSLEKKIYSRAIQKSNWAITELVALAKLRNKLSTPVQELYGSWAGAFGIPQFLPSSYLKWGVDGNDNKSIDLFEIEDAIFSIGNFLKSNGWGSSQESQKKALFAYNNSWDYVSRVLRLAGRIKARILQDVSPADSLKVNFN